MPSTCTSVNMSVIRIPRRVHVGVLCFTNQDILGALLHIQVIKCDLQTGNVIIRGRFSFHTRGSVLCTEQLGHCIMKVHARTSNNTNTALSVSAPSVLVYKYIAMHMPTELRVVLCSSYSVECSSEL